MAGCHHRHHHDYHHHDYHHQLLTTGGAVGFYSGNLKTLTADMKALKPTILPAVPRFHIDPSWCCLADDLLWHHPPSTRFLNRLYDSCVTTANKSSLFRYHLLIRSVSNDFQKVLFIIFSQFSRHIFNFALSSKTGELYKGIVRRDSIWDKLIFWLVF